MNLNKLSVVNQNLNSDNFDTVNNINYEFKNSIEIVYQKKLDSMLFEVFGSNILNNALQANNLFEIVQSLKTLVFDDQSVEPPPLMCLATKKFLKSIFMHFIDEDGTVNFDNWNQIFIKTKLPFLFSDYLKEKVSRYFEAFFFEQVVSIREPLICSHIFVIDLCSIPNNKEFEYNLIKKIIDVGFYSFESGFKKYEELCLFFLRNSGVNINCQNTLGDTVLMNTICEIDLWKSSFLIKAGADINIQNNKGETALMHALNIRDNTAVKILLETEDVDINIKNNEGKTALFLACEKGDRKKIKLFFKMKIWKLKKI